MQARRPLIFVRDIFRRNPDIQAEVERRVNFKRRLFSLELTDGFFEQPQISVKTDGCNVAVLFAAQQVPGAAQFQIERGDLEPCSKVREFPKRGQALPSDFAQLRCLCGTSRYAYALTVRSPHAPAQAGRVRSDAEGVPRFR